MIQSWIQFAILLGAIIGFFLRNERRITTVERDLRAEQRVSNMLDRRIATLERHRV